MATRKLGITVSRSANIYLNQLDSKVFIELELYFSCLIRKQVLIRPHPPAHGTCLETDDQRIQVYFRPVMTRICRTGEVIDAPEVTDFPLQREAAFTPRWLRLDTRHGELTGEYGF